MILSKIQKHIDNLKISFGCEMCGYNENPIGLDFAHINSKTKSQLFPAGRGSMSQFVKRCTLMNKELNIKRIHELFEEIRKCKVLCAICHRIETHEERSRGIHITKSHNKRTEIKFPGIKKIISNYRKRGLSLSEITKALLVEHGHTLCLQTVHNITKRNKIVKIKNEKMRKGRR